MNRTSSILISASLSLLLQHASICQTSSTAKTSPKSKPDPCGAGEQKSFSEGWKQGSESASKDSWGKGLTAGMELEQLVYSIHVGDTSPTQKISIVVEDIDGSTSYQFAAAEVARTYFADFLTVVPNSDLILHISGTKAMSLSYGDVQSINTEVLAHANQTVVVGDDKRLIYGSLQLSTNGGTLKGYSQQEKTQAVREYIYKTLSEYKDKWEKAAPKPSAP
jgi:hypothetical protein